MEIDSKNIQKSWHGWKSPVGLGFFFITTALALAIVLYTLLNLFVSIDEAMHPAAQSQGMSAQELQQLEQSAPADSGTGQ